MPVGAAGICRSGPMRGLGVPDLEPEAPVVGPLHPEPRKYSVQPGELHRGGLGVHLGRDERGSQQLAGEDCQVGRRGCRSKSRDLCPALQRRVGHAERVENRLGEVLREADLGGRARSSRRALGSRSWSRPGVCPARPSIPARASRHRTRAQAGAAPWNRADPLRCRVRRPPLRSRSAPRAPPGAWSPMRARNDAECRRAAPEHRTARRQRRRWIRPASQPCRRGRTSTRAYAIKSC